MDKEGLDEAIEEFIALSRQINEKNDETVNLLREQNDLLKGQIEEINNNFTHITQTSEILKIFQDTNKPEIREFAKRLVEGANEMAETKGEVKQMDKRIDDFQRWWN